MSNPSEVHEHFKKGENVMGDKIEFNEYRSAEYWTAFWARRMRRAFLLEKIAPYLIALGIIMAFLVVGYIEKAL